MLSDSTPRNANSCSRWSTRDEPQPPSGSRPRILREAAVEAGTPGGTDAKMAEALETSPLTVHRGRPALAGRGAARRAAVAGGAPARDGQRLSRSRPRGAVVVSAAGAGGLASVRAPPHQGPLAPGHHPLLVPAAPLPAAARDALAHRRPPAALSAALLVLIATAISTPHSGGESLTQPCQPCLTGMLAPGNRG